MKILAAGLFSLALVFLSSCASVSVKGENRAGGKPVQKPAQIYVADFSTANGTFNIVGAEAKNPDAFKQKMADMLSNYVVKSVSAHVAPAQRTPTGAKLPKTGWLITGEFVRVNTGSRALRATIGVGLGGTKMETRVAVTDLARKGPPFLTFETTGGSNAMPGMLLSTGPGNAAMNLLSQAMMGVTDDSARTSRMIAGELNNYMIERGWLGKDKKYSVKKLGDYQLVHEQYFH